MKPEANKNETRFVPQRQSAYLNLNTAKNDVTDAQIGWAMGNDKACVIAIERCIEQLAAAKLKMTPAKSRKPSLGNVAAEARRAGDVDCK